MNPILYTEAVFNNGRESLSPLVKTIRDIKDTLEKEIEFQNKSVKKARESKKSGGEKIKPNLFNPDKFWRNPLWKKFEDQLQKTFGFRSVQVQPYREKYLTKDKQFESKEINCFTFVPNRYPILGIVTDNGFYDKSRSINMYIFITLGLITYLSAEEIMAVLLHEFGHNIDPALVDIQYTRTNILSKYLTDREKDLTRPEKKIASDMKHNFDTIITPILIVGGLLGIVIWFIKSLFNKSNDMIDVENPEYQIEMRIQKIKDLIKKDPEFNRQGYSEAFADNFARMYGYGPEVLSGIQRISKDFDRKRRSRLKTEIDRQRAIMFITESSMKSKHRTQLHRVHSLINESKIDLQDPNIPPKVKKDIESDLKELEIILDSYLNDFSAFQNRINRIIHEELVRKNEKKNKILESVETIIIDDDLIEYLEYLIDNDLLLEAFADNYDKLRALTKKIGDKVLGDGSSMFVLDDDGNPKRDSGGNLIFKDPPEPTRLGKLVDKMLQVSDNPDEIRDEKKPREIPNTAKILHDREKANKIKDDLHKKYLEDIRKAKENKLKELTMLGPEGAAIRSQKERLGPSWYQAGSILFNPKELTFYDHGRIKPIYDPKDVSDSNYKHILNLLKSTGQNELARGFENTWKYHIKNNLFPARHDYGKKIDQPIPAPIFASVDINSELENFLFEWSVYIADGSLVDYIEEKKRSRERIPLTQEEYDEFNELFGEQECSLGKDKKGYYVYTHRAATKSYKSISKIPSKKVRWVSSTS